MLIEVLHADLLAMPSDLPYLAGNRSQLLGKLFKSDYLRNTVRWELPHNPAHSLYRGLWGDLRGEKG